MGGSFRYVLICEEKNCLVIEKNLSIHVQGKHLCKHMHDLCPQHIFATKIVFYVRRSIGVSKE